MPLQDGALAQLGERLHGMQEVSGSIPLGSTKFPFEKHQIVLPFSSVALPLIGRATRAALRCIVPEGQHCGTKLPFDLRLDMSAFIWNPHIVNFREGAVR